MSKLSTYIQQLENQFLTTQEWDCGVFVTVPDFSTEKSKQYEFESVYSYGVESLSDGIYDAFFFNLEDKIKQQVGNKNRKECILVWRQKPEECIWRETFLNQIVFSICCRVCVIPGNEKVKPLE